MENLKQKWNAFWNGKRFLCLQKIVHAGLGMLFLLFMVFTYFSVTVGGSVFRFSFYAAFTFATIFTIVWLVISLAVFVLPLFNLDKFDKVIRIIQFVMLLLLVLISLLIGSSQGYSFGIGFFFALIFLAIFSLYLFKKSLIEGIIGKLIPASLLPKKITPFVEPMKEPEPVQEVVVEPVKEEIAEPIKEEIKEDIILESVAVDAPEVVEEPTPEVVEEVAPEVVEEVEPVEEKKEE